MATEETPAASAAAAEDYAMRLLASNRGLPEHPEYHGPDGLRDMFLHLDEALKIERKVLKAHALSVVLVDMNPGGHTLIEHKKGPATSTAHGDKTEDGDRAAVQMGGYCCAAKGCGLLPKLAEEHALPLPGVLTVLSPKRFFFLRPPAPTPVEWKGTTYPAVQWHAKCPACARYLAWPWRFTRRGQPVAWPTIYTGLGKLKRLLPQFYAKLRKIRVQVKTTPRLSAAGTRAEPLCVEPDPSLEAPAEPEKRMFLGLCYGVAALTCPVADAEAPVPADTRDQSPAAALEPQNKETTTDVIMAEAAAPFLPRVENEAMDIDSLEPHVPADAQGLVEYDSIAVPLEQGGGTGAIRVWSNTPGRLHRVLCALSPAGRNAFLHDALDAKRAHVHLLPECGTDRAQWQSDLDASVLDTLELRHVHAQDTVEDTVYFKMDAPLPKKHLSLTLRASGHLVWVLVHLPPRYTLLVRPEAMVPLVADVHRAELAEPQTAELQVIAGTPGSTVTVSERDVTATGAPFLVVQAAHFRGHLRLVVRPPLGEEEEEAPELYTDPDPVTFLGWAGVTVAEEAMQPELLIVPQKCNESLVGWRALGADLATRRHAALVATRDALVHIRNVMTEAPPAVVATSLGEALGAERANVAHHAMAAVDAALADDVVDAHFPTDPRVLDHVLGVDGRGPARFLALVDGTRRIQVMLAPALHLQNLVWFLHESAEPNAQGVYAPRLVVNGTAYEPQLFLRGRDTLPDPRWLRVEGSPAVQRLCDVMWCGLVRVNDARVTKAQMTIRNELYRPLFSQGDMRQPTAHTLKKEYEWAEEAFGPRVRQFDLVRNFGLDAVRKRAREAEMEAPAPKRVATPPPLLYSIPSRPQQGGKSPTPPPNTGGKSPAYRPLHASTGAALFAAKKV